MMEKFKENETTSNNQDEKKNPLDIPEIVSIVSSYIWKVDNLKSVRTLNSAWMEETFQKWRDSAVFLINEETIPIILEAFKNGKDDPFGVRETPFKKYRFVGSQIWAYPVHERMSIWKDFICPNAIYLDLGEFSKLQYGVDGDDEEQKDFAPRLNWILDHCKNIQKIKMAPLKEWNNPEKCLKTEDLDFEVGIQGNYEDLLFAQFTAPAVELVSLSITILEGEDSLFLHQKRRIGQDAAEDYLTFAVASLINESLPKLKTLKLPSGGGANSIMAYLLRDHGYANFGDRLHLESLTAFSNNKESRLLPSLLRSYLVMFQVPLKELRMTLSLEDCCSRDDGSSELSKILQDCRGTLTKLELEIQCEREEKTKALEEFILGEFSLPNLVDFRVEVDYSTEQELMLFNMNNLRKMPKVQKFHFGAKREQDKVFAPKVESLPVINLSEELPDLQHFHFHGKFTNKAMAKLGVIMRNLKSLEAVFDEENFEVLDIWPGIKKVKLLSGSSVPKDIVSSFISSNAHLIVEVD